MGNAPSRYDETNWDEANGGLTSASETVDGAEPTSSHLVLNISPKVALPGPGHQLPLLGTLGAAREYEVKDADGNTLFTTKKVDKLEQGFDLVDKDGSTTLLRVDSTGNNRVWHIFNVGTPVFEGQHPDPEPSEKTGEQLYRKASVSYGKDVEHTALVYMFENKTGDDDVDTILKVERCQGGKVTSKWHFQTMLVESSPLQSQPLVGYWKWERSLNPMARDEKMVLDLAKGSDLALHVLLAVLGTIERSSIKAEYTG